MPGPWGPMGSHGVPGPMELRSGLILRAGHSLEAPAPAWKTLFRAIRAGCSPGLLKVVFKRNRKLVFACALACVLCVCESVHCVFQLVKRLSSINMQLISTFFSVGSERWFRLRTFIMWISNVGSERWWPSIQSYSAVSE